MLKEGNVKIDKRNNIFVMSSVSQNNFACDVLGELEKLISKVSNIYLLIIIFVYMHIFILHYINILNLF